MESKRPYKSRDKATRETYGARIGERLQNLREKLGWNRAASVADGLRDQWGVKVAESTVYSWERGAENGGADMPPYYYPYVADVLGVTIHELLPSE